MNNQNQVAIAARSASIEKIGSDWASLRSLGEQVGLSTIKFVNLGREIGLGLQGLCQHEQMKISFYEHIKEKLPDTMTFSAIQRCIYLANNMPNPASTLEEANRVASQMWLALGELELRHRIGKQTDHGKTQAVDIFNMLAKTRDNINKLVEDLDLCDSYFSGQLLKQIEQFEESLGKIKLKLNHEETSQKS